ncbi:MAG: OmpA family protein [Bacteroidetes bacterium]|nr:OmpA family protein [Bacteroidota bacterium]
MKINNLTMLAALAVLLGTGCVSTQKYSDMQTARDHFKAEYENLRVAEQENQELKNKLRLSETQMQQQKDILAQTKYELDRTKAYNKELALDYETAAKENSKLLSQYSADKADFEEDISISQGELLRQERQLKGLEETLGMQGSSMESIRSDLASRERRVAELERLVAEKEAQMAQLRISLNDALRGFSAADLTVEERNGKIYVSMSQNLLFKLGSDKVDPKGAAALQQLATALNANPAIEVIVEGHTDNTGGVDFNWDLSTRRATAVVKILAISGIQPGRMTASGRGMHHPVVPNDSEANKGKNRRTEIILSPNLDKLLELTK